MYLHYIGHCVLRGTRHGDIFETGIVSSCMARKILCSRMFNVFPYHFLLTNIHRLMASTRTVHQPCNLLHDIIEFRRVMFCLQYFLFVKITAYFF